MRGRAIIDPSTGRIQRAGTDLEEGIPLPAWAEVKDLPHLRWTGTEWVKETLQ